MVVANWTVLASYADHTSAAVVVGLLESENIPSRTAPDAVVPGLNSPCQILVPPELLDRARQLLSERPPSEAELTVLATGEVPDNERSP